VATRRPSTIVQGSDFVKTRLACLLLAFISVPALADDDAEGCKDHPLFTRLPSYHIGHCESNQFDGRGFPVGAPLGEESKLKIVDVEGPMWQITYDVDEGAKPASPLQVRRNYQNAVKGAGGIVEGEWPGWCKGNYDNEKMPIGNGCTNDSTTLKLAKAGKEVWTYVQSDDEDSFTLVIVEREAMKQDIGVNELVDKINKEGFIALYVNFDTGKATIKPDSTKTLDDAATALKSAPDLKIEVGGHTDNVGNAEANQKLSEERARAVLDALVARGVAAARLTAKGYGQSAPVADNRSEDGRAKNRRVELTKK
jgi:OmpA-OmpF porin, OOP family